METNEGFMSVIKKVLTPIIASTALIASGSTYVSNQSDLNNVNDEQLIIMTKTQIRDSIQDAEINEIRTELKEVKSMIQKLDTKVTVIRSNTRTKHSKKESSE